MNKKITVRSITGQSSYCILSGDKDLEKQLNNWYFGSDDPQNGVCVRFNGIKLDVVDYYHDDRMASFDVVSIEDTNEAPLLNWIDI